MAAGSRSESDERANEHICSSVYMMGWVVRGVYSWIKPNQHI